MRAYTHSPLPIGTLTLFMNNILSTYRLVYEITALPTILFAQSTTAEEPLEFRSFEIPEPLQGTPVECRFLLFNQEGNLIELSSNIYPGYPSTLAAACSLIPLKMINKLLDNLQPTSDANRSTGKDISSGDSA